MIKHGWILGLSLATLAQGAVALDLDGRLAWAQRVALGTVVSGVVSAVPAQAGQRVTKGDQLLQLDARSFRTELTRARALLSRAASQLDEARREDERAQELYDRTLLSDHERQLAQIDRVAAESKLAEAKAAVSRAQLAFERSELKAPFDARVLAVNAAVGQAIVSQLQSQPLVVIADAEQMLAEADISASQLGDLAVGQAAQVGWDGRWLAGQIASISLEPTGQNDREALYRIQVSFAVPEQGVLRAGLPAVLRLGGQ